jgi:hypothetical protein
VPVGERIRVILIHPFPKKKSSPFTVQSAYAPKWLTHIHQQLPKKKQIFFRPFFGTIQQPRVHFPHVRMFRLQITGSPPCVPSTTRKNCLPQAKDYMTR